MILTIMIPTTFDRRELFTKLCLFVYRQIFENNLYDEVELIWDEDNKEKSIGKKRQDLLERAKGKYIVGIDSDDWIADTYVIDIIDTIKNNEDVDHIGFYENCNINGEISKSIFSIEFKKWETINNYHIRCANPKSVIKKTKALQIGFEDMRYEEDRIFSEKVTSILETEKFIDKELYFYISNRQLNLIEHNKRYGII